ncbi:unnamed protein product [Prorocentrum cordatum]|uniref:Anaphase-promoting complex subunit 1 n=1 Tax=Prorocentrum cordatum TaxID=2364126 RepID=A0ABN9XH66_9DINO|nr:unnamed protein product [Polarella glacialis]
MGCLETMHPAREPVPLVCKWSRADGLEVLAFFWLPPPQQPGSADLAVVTTQDGEGQLRHVTVHVRGPPE